MGFMLFIIRRLGRLILTVLIISTVVFLVLRIIPGDPAEVIAGIDSSPEDVEKIRRQLGTDISLAAQYGRWLGDIANLNFGTSYMSGQPVGRLILQRFPLTLALAVLAMVISVLIAIPLGVLSAVHRWSFWDYTGMAISQIGMAVPSFWLGILLLLFFSVKLGIFPIFGAGGFKHLVLPALSLGLARAAVLLRVTRASMLDELNREYMVTARAKGLPEIMVRYKHALKNALLPVVTIAGIQFGYMLGGSIIIEQVFSLPGVGRLLLTAVNQQDFPLIQGGVVFVAIVFSLINFLVDIVYSLLNPKIRTS
ncbi:MAG: ABC transporter permease [Spirochaetales bacterium]|jgi:peptide/nickel transport system permease protein|nr:ABC transporter permease [Spirochaetales bacterium]